MSHIYRLTTDVNKMSLGDNNVTKVYKGLDQIWPAYVPPPQYHVVTPFSGGVPSGWSSGGSISSGGGGIYSPGGSGSVTYSEEGGMPSLRNAYKVVINVVFAFSSESDGLYVSLRTGTTINYRGRSQGLDGTTVLGVGQYVYNGGDDINWDNTFTTSDLTITGTLGFVNGEREGETIVKSAETQILPYGKYTGLDDTQIDAIKGSDNLHIELIGGVVVKSIDMYIYNDMPVQPVGAGLYWNEGLGLLSMSSNGTDWITITDKNLGATVGWDVGDTSRDYTHVGYRYEWGNNCPLELSDGITHNGTYDTTGYGPGNYFYNTYLIDNQGDWDNMDRSDPHNNNLWGGETGTDEARQGPCPNGYHIGSVSQWRDIYNTLINLGFGNNHFDALKMPPDFGRGYATSDASNTHFTEVGKHSSNGTITTNVGAPKAWIDDGNWMPLIRPMKNTPTTPDTTWTQIFPSAPSDWPKDGFEIPTAQDVIDVGNALKRLTGGSSSDERVEYLYIPRLYLERTGGYNNTYPGVITFWTRSTILGNGMQYLYAESGRDSDVSYTTGSECRPIRPFKSTFVMPTSSPYLRTPIVGDLTNGGIFHNHNDEIISIYEPNGVQKTIADKNLGAFIVYSDGDQISYANGGYFYQRGNCYGFDTTESTSSTVVDTSSYGPNNRYYSNVRYGGGDSHSWEVSHNATLWDPVTPSPTPYNHYTIDFTNGTPASDWVTNTTVDSGGLISGERKYAYIQIGQTDLSHSKIEMIMIHKEVWSDWSFLSQCLFKTPHEAYNYMLNGIGRGIQGYPTSTYKGNGEYTYQTVNDNVGNRIVFFSDSGNTAYENCSSGIFFSVISFDFTTGDWTLYETEGSIDGNILYDTSGRLTGADLATVVQNFSSGPIYRGFKFNGPETGNRVVGADLEITYLS